MKLIRLVMMDLARYPATWALAGLWVAVFIAEALVQGDLPMAGGPLMVGTVGTDISSLFGDVTPRELASGQFWRVITANFVHLNIPHLVLNLLALVQLGRIVESAYGPGQSLAIYLVIGGLGNFMDESVRLAWARHGTGEGAAVAERAAWINHSAGGSTILCGLLGLLAVAGWRDRTRFGEYVTRVMVGLLILTAAFGAVARHFGVNVDDLGHASGAFVGALIGLAHPVLVRTAGRRRIARPIGLAALLALVACGLAQARAADLEVARRRQVRQVADQGGQPAKPDEGLLRAQKVLLGLGLIREIHAELTRRGPGPRATFPPASVIWPERILPPPWPNSVAGRPFATLSITDLRDRLRRYLGELDAIQDDLGTGPTADDYRRMRALAYRALYRAPTPGGYHAFRLHLDALIGRVVRELAVARPPQSTSAAPASGPDPSR